MKINRSAGAFRSSKEAKRYWVLLTVFVVLGLLAAYGLLVYQNPVPITSPSFLPVIKRRTVALIAMLIAAICQSLSTVAFQSTTGNRIITPSLLGFEALYTTIHTSTMFFFGAGVFVSLSGSVESFLLQIIVMIVMSLILYGWLLSGKYGNLQLMLLVGIIMGTGLKSISSFMRRLLDPSAFDVLQAQLFGSVSHADASYLPIAIPLVLIAAILLFAFSNKLNVLALGRNACTSLGINFQRNVIYSLILVSILMSVSTALVGPLTFFGFLVAMITYQLAPTYDHRFLFLMALAIGFLVLTGSYFFMYHVFRAQGVVSVIIEMFGGVAFLLILLKKGSL